MNIIFNNFEFEGLKLRKYTKFPWNNNKERQEFYGNLIENGTNYNRSKAQRFVELEAKESIHINLSWSYASTAFSIILLLIMAGTLTSTSALFSLILGGLVVVGMVSKYFFRKKANNRLFELKMDYDVIDIMFNGKDYM